MNDEIFRRYVNLSYLIRNLSTTVVSENIRSDDFETGHFGSNCHLHCVSVL